MHAAAILCELHRRGARLEVESGALRVTPGAALDDELRGIIRQNKTELLACGIEAPETLARPEFFYPRDFYDPVVARDFALTAPGLTEAQRAALLKYADAATNQNFLIASQFLNFSKDKP